MSRGLFRPIDFRPYAEMGSSLDLKISAPAIAIELTGQRPFDVAAAGFVPYDQIAVAGIRDAHQFGQVHCGARVQGTAQFGR